MTWWEISGGPHWTEPTITPTPDQVARLGLKKPWGSPNGAMRRGWNGITISRDTIHIDGGAAEQAINQSASLICEYARYLHFGSTLATSSATLSNLVC